IIGQLKENMINKKHKSNSPEYIKNHILTQIKIWSGYNKNEIKELIQYINSMSINMLMTLWDKS
ncbi:MAG: hypothetical protein ACTSQS_18185, partial [Promethearchaeota archaeon]